jgi:ankyrin repeat protein
VDLLLKDERTHINYVNTIERGTPLHLAAKRNYLPICQILLLRGVDFTIKDGNGNLAKDVTTAE